MNTPVIYVNIFKIRLERALLWMMLVVKYNNFKKVKNVLTHITNKLKHYILKLCQLFSLKEDMLETFS